MRVDVRRIGDADLVAVDGVLDESTAPLVRAVLHARIVENRADLLVDLWRVRRLDRAGVDTLADIGALAATRGGRLRVAGAHGLCRSTLRASGAAIEICAPDVEADHPADRWPGSDDITVHALLAAAVRLERTSPHRAALRAQAIEDSLPLARHLALRFRDRGEPVDDLMQVAAVGLLHAVDGYDPGRGGAVAPHRGFAGYATPTVVGEIRRYFRDSTWHIRVPRRVQELRAELTGATRALLARNAAPPRPIDLARHLNVTERHVGEAIDANHYYRLPSLIDSTGGATRTMAGFIDSRFDAVDDRESVKSLLAALPDRERRILALRYLHGRTQSQIAAELGISQMHVSRLLANVIRRLREALPDR